MLNNSITIYYCPKCGKPLTLKTNMVLTTYPPQYQFECDNCGYIGYSGSLPTNIDPYMPSQYSTNRDGWICPICGTPISPYIDYCPICTKKQFTALDSGQPMNNKWLNTATSSVASFKKREEG